MNTAAAAAAAFPLYKIEVIADEEARKAAALEPVLPFPQVSKFLHALYSLCTHRDFCPVVLCTAIFSLAGRTTWNIALT